MHNTGTLIIGVLILIFGIATTIMPLVGIYLIVKFMVKLMNDDKNFERSVAELFSQYAQINGGNFYPGVSRMKTGGSFKNLSPSDVLLTKISTGNKLWLYYLEAIRKQNSEYFLPRTVLAVEVPDIMAQFLIRSNLNKDADMQTVLDEYDAKQKLKLEGNFSDFFTVYSPNELQQDLLTLLAPNVMEDILQNFSKNDIEVDNNILYIYITGTLKPAEALVLIKPLDDLVAKMRLRLQDGRSVNAQGGPEVVAPSATDNTFRKNLSIKNKTILKFSVGTVVAILIIYFKENSSLIILPILLVGVIVTIIQNKQQEKLKKRYAEALNAHVNNPKTL